MKKLLVFIFCVLLAGCTKDNNKDFESILLGKYQCTTTDEYFIFSEYTVISYGIVSVGLNGMSPIWGTNTYNYTYDDEKIMIESLGWYYYKMEKKEIVIYSGEHEFRKVK